MDIIYRIRNKQIFDKNNASLDEKIDLLINKASALYSEIGVYEPKPLEEPKLASIKRQIDERDPEDIIGDDLTF